MLISDAPKYGNDDDYADKLVTDAYDIYVDEIAKISKYPLADAVQLAVSTQNIFYFSHVGQGRGYFWRQFQIPRRNTAR